MLSIKVPGVESFDDVNQVFVTTDDTVLELEHSLVSLSKWESRYEKPFLSSEEKTTEEVYGYVQAMSLRGEIPPEVLFRLTEQNQADINQYIEAKMTATWFNEANARRSFNAPAVTAEVIYHWLVGLQIPWEAEHWHLNRLITLVKTINEKNKENTDKKKAPTTSDLADRHAIMERRRAEAAARAKEGS